MKGACGVRVGGSVYRTTHVLTALPRGSLRTPHRLTPKRQFATLTAALQDAPSPRATDAMARPVTPAAASPHSRAHPSTGSRDPRGDRSISYDPPRAAKASSRG